jgi:hypothetical protein
MRFDSIDRHTGVLSISLSEIIAEYDKACVQGYKYSYICFMLSEVGSRYFTKVNGEKMVDCLDDEKISEQFRAQWCEKVLGGVKGSGDTIDGWNEGSKYGVGKFGWVNLDQYCDDSDVNSRRKYRIRMLRGVLKDIGDIEFSFVASVEEFWRDQF